MTAPSHLDTLRCKHCDAVVALLPRVAVVNRLAIRCLHCGVVLVVWPPDKKYLDVMPEKVYADAVPV